jgi:hypothetical protein
LIFLVRVGQLTSHFEILLPPPPASVLVSACTPGSGLGFLRVFPRFDFHHRAQSSSRLPSFSHQARPIFHLWIQLRPGSQVIVSLFFIRCFQFLLCGAYRFIDFDFPIDCGLLQDKVGITLELPDQKARDFLVQIALKLFFTEYVHKVFREIHVRT